MNYLRRSHRGILRLGSVQVLLISFLPLVQKSKFSIWIPFFLGKRRFDELINNFNGNPEAKYQGIPFD